jgi:hypothetical protein
MVSTETVLLCEVAEMFAAIEHCKMKEAIEEAYDCIAVLLRIVDVLEGRQALGNPTKKEGAKTQEKRNSAETLESNGRENLPV